MATAPRHCEFRFYGELGDLLPAGRRGRGFAHAFEGTPSVKDQIEALGVPHTEVDLILVDGMPAGFRRKLRGGERVAVYPMFRRLEPDAQARLQPPPLEEPRFVVDVHLGRLASYLRLLGFDCLYRNDYRDDDLLAISRSQQRILLSRDTGRSSAPPWSTVPSCMPPIRAGNCARSAIVTVWMPASRRSPAARAATARCSPGGTPRRRPRPGKRRAIPASSAAAATADSSTGRAATSIACGGGWQRWACSSEAGGRRR